MVIPAFDREHLVAGSVVAPPEGEYSVWLYQWSLRATPGDSNIDTWLVDNDGRIHLWAWGPGSYYRYEGGAETLIGAYTVGILEARYRPSRTVFGKYMVCTTAFGANSVFYVYAVDRQIFTRAMNLDFAGINQINHIGISPDGRFIGAFVEDPLDRIILYMGV